jgi:hypothetical protein
MTIHNAVLGAAAQVRGQTTGTGLKALGKSMRIVYIALFASFVSQQLLLLRHT